MAYQDGSVSSQEKGPKPIVYALDERRRAALAEVDNAKFSYVSTLHTATFTLTRFFFRWFHAKVCLVAGVGFFTDA